MSGKLCSYEGAVDLPTDLTFIIKEENGLTKTIEAHKYFLTKASPVFRALIYNKWNQDCNETNEISIKANYESFKSIIDYVYTNNLNFENMSIEQLKEIEKLADWYHLPAISDQINLPPGSRSDPIYQNFPPSTDVLKLHNVNISVYNFLKLTPTDVEFEIHAETETGEEDEETKENNAKNNTIVAHKYHLAIFSSVFKAMFFGPLKQDRVTVKGTSFKAFRYLIDWMYGCPAKLSSLSTHQLFHVYNLGEMYDVPGIKSLAENQIMGTKFTRANTLEVAFEAEHWSQYDELSEKLLKKSIAYLSREVLRTKKDIIDFSSTNSSSPMAPTAFRLLARLPECQNCNSVPCLRGKLVQMGEVVPGIKISSYDDTISGRVIGAASRDTEVTVETGDGRTVTFSCENPPKDADVVQNPVYYHVFFKKGIVRGGIYWNCD